MEVDRAAVDACVQRWGIENAKMAVDIVKQAELIKELQAQVRELQAQRQAEAQQADAQSACKGTVSEN